MTRRSPGAAPRGFVAPMAVRGPGRPGLSRPERGNHVVVPSLDTGSARIEYEVTGDGDPVTVFAHGVGATVAETRLLCAGVGGTCVFLQFRGHGASSAHDGRYDYAALAGDLLAVADRTRATRALGVSMGAGALLRLLVDDPARFERVVLFLPAVLDKARPVTLARLERKADLVDAGDAEGLVEAMRDEMPEGITAGGGQAAAEDLDRFIRGQAESLVGTEVSELLRRVPHLAPLDDLGQLTALDLPALVVGQEGDEVHPAAVARTLAEHLPDARLALFPEGSGIWSDTDRLEALVGGFLREPQRRTASTPAS